MLYSTYYYQDYCTFLYRIFVKQIHIFCIYCIMVQFFLLSMVMLHYDSCILFIVYALLHFPNFIR